MEYDRSDKLQGARRPMCLVLLHFVRDHPHENNHTAGKVLEIIKMSRYDLVANVPMEKIVMTQKVVPAHLGQKSDLPLHPSIDILDPVMNAHRGSIYVARFTCPEFTSLCPVTGQPDFATLIIDYIPNDLLVESKSLKLYLASYRNHGLYHESCTVQIGKDVRDKIKPQWIRIAGFWMPRGGIPIDVFWEFGEILGDIHIPDFGVPTYRGR